MGGSGITMSLIPTLPSSVGSSRVACGKVHTSSMALRKRSSPSNPPPSTVIRGWLAPAVPRVLPAGGSSHSSEPLLLFLSHPSGKWAESDNHLQQLFYHPVQRCVYT